MGKLAKYAAFNTFGEARGGQEAYISFLESRQILWVKGSQ